MIEVLDVNDRDFYRPVSTGDHHVALLRWLRDHGLCADDIYRLELHVLDAPLIRVFSYARGQDGRCYVEPDEDGELQIALAPPRDVLMRSRPPVPFRPVDTDAQPKPGRA